MSKRQQASWISGVALVAAPALAGGLYVTEFGDPSMGALAQDASTAFHNPAGIMSLEPGKNHWMVSALYVDPFMKFSKEPGSTVAPLAAASGGPGR